jgi:hypothetical protein
MLKFNSLANFVTVMSDDYSALTRMTKQLQCFDFPRFCTYSELHKHAIYSNSQSAICSDGCILCMTLNFCDLLESAFKYTCDVHACIQLSVLLTLMQAQLHTINDTSGTPCILCVC